MYSVRPRLACSSVYTPSHTVRPVLTFAAWAGSRPAAPTAGAMFTNQAIPAPTHATVNKIRRLIGLWALLLRDAPIGKREHKHGVAGVWPSNFRSQFRCKQRGPAPAANPRRHGH